MTDTMTDVTNPRKAAPDSVAARLIEQAPLVAGDNLARLVASAFDVDQADSTVVVLLARWASHSQLNDSAEDQEQPADDACKPPKLPGHGHDPLMVWTPKTRKASSLGGLSTVYCRRL